MSKYNILIIGHAGHGKTTVAEMLNEEFGYIFKDSSMAAAELFLFDQMKNRFGYNTVEECHADRVHHRKYWHDAICTYNHENPSRLAEGIMATSDIYCGMRSQVEIDKCLRDGLFDVVVTVFDPRKPLEPRESMGIDPFEVGDVIIWNTDSLATLRYKVTQVLPFKIKIHTKHGR